MMRQCNTVDVTRRSPSYEVRLSKYSSRDFEVYVPQLNRADIECKTARFVSRSYFCPIKARLRENWLQTMRFPTKTTRAKQLEKIPDLVAVLLAKLGWATNKSNETVVTAAITGQRADVLEALLSLSGKDVEPMLHFKYVVISHDIEHD